MIVKLESAIQSATFDLPEDLSAFQDWIKLNEWKETFFLSVVERKSE